MIAESTHSADISEILPLGFGKCSLQVQVPVKSPYQTVESLVGRRVATSFEVLAGELFGRLDKDSQEGKKTQVEYVGGSVEAACALGMADGIGTCFRLSCVVLDETMGKVNAWRKSRCRTLQG